MSLRVPGLRSEPTYSVSGFLPDASFYPSPRMAAKAPPETFAYVALVNPRTDGRPDAIGVVDCNPNSDTFGRILGRTELPYAGDELHHFGWNACSSSLCPYAPHPHAQRRYLVVPGMRSSRIYIVDTQPDPLQPRIAKIIEPEEIFSKTGYSRPHSVHCGPGGIYVSALGAPNGGGPGGIFLLDHDSFEVRGRWEIDRGPQQLAYDFAWHLGYDTMITSEWGTPNMIEGGLQLDQLVGKKYGRAIHVWDLRRRRHLKRLAAGDDDQMTLELRPAHDPTKAYGFVGVVVSVKDLSSSIWMWHREGDDWEMHKVIEIPAEPADPALLPPALRTFEAVPPLVSDIDLSVDDRFLYVSCWGTGELRQYDVTDPFRPRLTGTVQIGGIVRRASHPSRPGEALNGGPQMVEVSRDGRRVYVTNSLYLPWDAQFYPDGIRGWLAKLDANPSGGLTADPAFFTDFPDGTRPHQVRLEGGDASSDSYCYP
ncbi:MAG TPA: selenium-binding protein SBP56-related protein [Gemmatimonadaceae bacterium]|nr:selenium-binding protein SBP56-related protein [Gemmatimonadaceae bacterium]